MCCQTPGAGTRVFCRWAPSIFLSCQKQQPQRNAERNHCNVWNVKAGEKNSVKTVECVVTQTVFYYSTSIQSWMNLRCNSMFFSSCQVKARRPLSSSNLWDSSVCMSSTNQQENEYQWAAVMMSSVHIYIYNTVQWGIPHNNIDTVWGKEHFSLFSFCCIVYWDIVYMMEEWLGIPPYSKDIAGSIPCGSGLSVCVVSSRFSNLLISWTSILYV